MSFNINVQEMLKANYYGKEELGPINFSKIFNMFGEEVAKDTLADHKAKKH